MIRKLILTLLIAHCFIVKAQTIKTDVVVIGADASGVAAAIQSARSKVKTILVTEKTAPGTFADNGVAEIKSNCNIQSGIWWEFRNHVRDFYKKNENLDTAQNAPLSFDPNAGALVLKKITDTVKNLEVYLNSPFTSIKKDGDRWVITLIQNKKTIRILARVVVDATENGAVVANAGIKLTDVSVNQAEYQATKLYRTSIATIETIPQRELEKSVAPENSDVPKYVAMNSVLVKDADNILCIDEALSQDKNIQSLPLQLEIGQGVGAIAAYCVFFKTTTSHLKVRIIQGEILDFKGYLLPFSDVKPNDTAWRAIQQIGATGILQGNWQVQGSGLRFVFQPDKPVNTAEIKPVLTEIYSRAFLWFSKEKPGEKFTIGNLLSLISDYTLTDPKVLNRAIQKDWKTKYAFKIDFDEKRAVTRREFAVLVNKFLNPFARTVDLDGRLVN